MTYCSRALGRLSQFACSAVTCLKDATSDMSSALVDCRGKVCEAAMAGIKKVDEWIGFIDPMAKAIKNTQEKDYVGTAREIVIAAQFYPKAATLYIGCNFAKAYAGGGTYSSDLAIPIVFASCSLITIQRGLDALEAHMLQKKIEVFEADADTGSKATAVELQNLNPAKFTRLFFLGQNIRHLSSLSDLGIEAVKNTTSLVLKHKFRFKSAALVGQLFMAYLSIRQGNHEAELMNKQAVVLSINGATLFVITGAKLVIEGIAAKKLKAAIMGNQQTTFLTDVVVSGRAIPERARASSYDLASLLEDSEAPQDTCSTDRSSQSSPPSLEDTEDRPNDPSPEISSSPSLQDIANAYKEYSDASAPKGD